MNDPQFAGLFATPAPPPAAASSAPSMAPSPRRALPLLRLHRNLVPTRRSKGTAMRKAPHLAAGFAALLSSTLLQRPHRAARPSRLTVRRSAGRSCWRKSSSIRKPVKLLGRLIGEALVNQYAEQHHIVVTDAEVAARERELRAQFPGKKWNDMLAVRQHPIRECRRSFAPSFSSTKSWRTT